MLSSQGLCLICVAKNYCCALLWKECTISFALDILCFRSMVYKPIRQKGHDRYAKISDAINNEIFNEFSTNDSDEQLF